MDLGQKYTLLFIIVIAIAGFGAYANSLGGEFIWDDNWYVKQNPYIKDISHLPDIFTKDMGEASGNKYGFYRPVQTLTYMFDYYLWKLDARGYHLSSIIYHILVALALYWLVFLLYKDRLLSFFTGLLFVVHPIHTDAVSYISARSESLALFFMLLSFIFYIKNLRAGSGLRVLAMGLSFALALLSREVSIVLILLLLLYHYQFRKKIIIRQLALMLSLCFLYLLLRATLLKHLLLDEPLCATTALERLPGFFAALATYIRLLFFPFDLHVEYGNRLFSFSEPAVFTGLVILAAFIVYALRQRHKPGRIFFALSWFFIGLLPFSNIYPLNAYLQEHWLYTPSLGFFLALGIALRWLYDRKGVLRKSALVLCAGLLIFYSYLTVKQNNYFKDPLTFYERTLGYAPESTRVRIELGNTYMALGQKAKAIGMLERAIELDPDFAEAYNSLGAVYDLSGRKPEALKMFRKAIEVDPGYVKAYNNLAIFYFNQGDFRLAIEYCDKAKGLGFVNPALAQALENKSRLNF